MAADFIVLSPGVRADIPILQEALRRRIPVHSEIELAYRLSHGKRLVVTGSNGKTTTTTLLHQFCAAAFPRVFLGGNIGIPMMEFALQTREGDIQVLEVSSFQLETISTFTPDIALITNFFENHLDRYQSYAAYRSAKERIAMNMTDRQWLILNADQTSMHELATRMSCRIAWFGWNLDRQRPGVTLRDDMYVWIDENGREQALFSDSAVRLIGRHNRANIMAATAAGFLAGIAPDIMERQASECSGVEHRLEWVREVNGVTWINDSKGTNCAASMTALAAVPKGCILLAGGRDKGTDLGDWVEAIRVSCKGVILFGESRDRFRAVLEGVVPLKISANLEQAVALAAAWAAPGDTVLLSPACSSYDQFPNFEERGRCFKSRVLELPVS